MAAYNFFFPPQIAIRRYTGTNSSSHAKKNNRKSWERKTSACADACTNKRAKYRLDFFLIFQLAAADKNVIKPLKATSGAGPSILALCKKENGKNVSQAMVKAWEKAGVASRAPFLNVQTTGSQFSTI